MAIPKRADRPEERYHAPNTLKAARTLKLSKGHVLYSDEARPMFTLVEDIIGDDRLLALAERLDPSLPD